MKKYFSILSFLPFLAQASITNQTVAYERLGAVGEHPLAYKAIEDTTIQVRKGPSTLFEAAEKCSVKKDFDTGMGDLQKTLVTDKFVVTKAFIYSDENSQAEPKKITTIKVNEGDIVENLSYLGEDICDIRIGGQIFEDVCAKDNKFAPNLKQVTEMKQQNWYFLSCTNNSGWVLGESLSQAKGFKAHRPTLEK